MADTKATRPARLDIVDMPRDKNRVLGGLRLALCASFNYCRKYPAKMLVLKEVLEYVVERINNHSKVMEDIATAQRKEQLEVQARELGFELDSRMSVENMEKDLAEKVAKSVSPETNPNPDKSVEPVKEIVPDASKEPEPTPTETKSISSPVGGAKVANNSTTATKVPTGKVTGTKTETKETTEGDK